MLQYLLRISLTVGTAPAMPRQPKYFVRAAPFISRPIISLDISHEIFISISLVFFISMSFVLWETIGVRSQIYLQAGLYCQRRIVCMGKGFSHI